jgi:hypothetical protein
MEPMSCGDGQGAEVFFDWTAPTGGSFPFDAHGSTIEDATLYALDEHCDGRELACAAPADSTASIQLSLDEGNSIVLVVDAPANQTGMVVVKRDDGSPSHGRTKAPQGDPFHRVGDAVRDRRLRERPRFLRRRGSQPQSASPR